MGDKVLYVIVGPTGSGKTALAIRLALHLGAEIISADSRQVFKELDKGTAKPTDHELSMVPHHLVNSHSIHERFDAADYGAEARRLMEELFARLDHVILCGGSGLYVKAALEGFDDMPPIPSEIRQAIAGEYSEKGLAWLQQEVMKVDPDYFDVVDRQNPQRLMRALEVTRASGSPFSSFRRKEKINLPFRVVKIGLCPPREELYERIEKRMDDMISHGLFEEAQKLYPLRNLNALQTVGYQEIFGFMDGSYDREEAVRLLKRNSRRYAKRQLTWFKRDADIRWFAPDDWDGILEYIHTGSNTTAST
jgi:tRNA dimethylallyltransferase